MAENTTAGERLMTPLDLRIQRSDWRFFAALSIVFAILVVVVAVSFHSDQRSASLHSPDSVVNFRPAARTVSN
jgi:hypothetical protein